MTTTTTTEAVVIPTQGGAPSSDVVLYTKPNCSQCRATKRRLDAKGIEYSTVDISVDEAAYELVVSMGFQQAPVVIAGEQSWAGFQPAKIDALAS